MCITVLYLPYHLIIEIQLFLFLHGRSSRKVGVRPLLTEPGTRLRYFRAAVTDHYVSVF